MVAVAGVAGVTMAAPDASKPHDWYAGYLENSRLIELANGRRLNLYCLGSGAPTVILEAGIGGFAFDWWPIQRRIASHTRVCAYDRAGMGRSPAGPLPRDTRSQVADLEALLSAARIGGPYVVVGHSMGGYNARMFAGRRLDDIAGIVLVDPSAENQIPVLEAAVPEIAKQDAAAVAYARSCADPQRTAEVAKRCSRSAPDSFPPDLAETFAASQGLVQSQTFHAEVDAFLNANSRQVTAERRALGDIPLIVLTRSQLSTNMPRTQAETEWRLWNQMHADIATLSRRASHRVVPDAGHYIQTDQPDAVVGAIVEVVEAYRGR